MRERNIENRLFGCVSDRRLPVPWLLYGLIDLREARGGELGGHGVQHSNSILHAAVRHHEHRVLQVADEQGPRVHHVPPLLRLRGGLADVRVRVPGVPGLGTRTQRSSEDDRWTRLYGSRHRHHHRRRRVLGRPAIAHQQSRFLGSLEERQGHRDSFPEAALSKTVVDVCHPLPMVPVTLEPGSSGVDERPASKQILTNAFTLFVLVEIRVHIV